MNVYGQRITSQGFVATGFPAEGIRLVQRPGDEFVTEVLQDGAGGAFVIVNTQFSDDLYAQHLMPDGSIAPGWPSTGAPVCVFFRRQHLAKAVEDGTGGLFVFWQDERTISGTPELYAIRLGPDGLPAPGWPANGRPMFETPARRGGISIIKDGSGGYYLGWLQDSALPQGGSVYCLRLTADGEPHPSWPTEGKFIVGPRFLGDLASDGFGGVYASTIVPTADGFDDKDYYLHRFDGSGALSPGWLPAGNPVCRAPNFRFNLQMISDHQGGAIFQWQDSRIFGFYELLYAARMGPDGLPVPGWPVDGQRVTTQDSYQGVSSMVADGAGGAYFAYRNLVSGDTGYIQHLGGNGSVAPGWPTVGYELGPFARWPNATTDGAGGAIATWYNGSTNKIYAQRYVFTGIVATNLSLALSEARFDRVSLVWQGEGAEHLNAQVYRRGEAENWQRLGRAERETADRLRFEDRAVTPGGRYAYRLGFDDGGIENFTAETWIDVPLTATLSLDGFHPNPAVEHLSISFSLPSVGRTTLDVLDLAGRRVRTHDASGLPAGRHLVQLDRGAPLHPGVYWVRLTHENRVLTIRGMVLR